MFGVLKFAATATLAEVVRGIHRTMAHRVALVFPLGAHVSLAEIGRMGVVDLLCREQRKEATIVGGDAELRACAVVCGLRAAVTVEDWRTMRTPRGTWLSWRKAQPPAPVQLTLLPPVTAMSLDDRDADDEHDPGDDLPTYIRELLALHGHEPPAESERPYLHSLTSPLTAPTMAQRQTSIAYDLDPDDDLRDLCESDEERLTEAIRRSSGLSRTTLARQWRPALVSASDGAIN